MLFRYIETSMFRDIRAMDVPCQNYQNLCRGQPWISRYVETFFYFLFFLFLFILRRMGKNKAYAPTLPRIRYMCFDLTHAPVATARAAATEPVSMSTRLIPKDYAPTLPRIRYMCFDLTHAPVATTARAAATEPVSMSTRPDREGFV